MQSKKDFFSEKLDLESFFLLIKPDNNIYYDNIKKRIIYGEIEKVISLGLKNLEISWSNNKNWLDFVYKIKLNFPTINLGSASILNKKSIDDSLSIGLKYSMMKSWDKDLFNYAKAKKHLLIPGIKNLKDLKEAIKLNCKIIKIYPITSKDSSIDLSHYKNIDFIAAGGLSGKYRNGQMPKNSRMSLFKGWERMINPLAMKAYDEYYKLAKEKEVELTKMISR